MSRLSVSGCALVLAIFAPFAVSAGDMPDLSGRTISFATAGDYKPYAYVDEATNKVAGFDIDMIEEAARRLNAKVSWSVVNWDVMLQAIRDKQFDAGVDGITITDERKGVVDFSNAYVTAQTRMLVRTDESRFNDKVGFLAVENASVVVVPGTSQFYVASGEFFGGAESHPRMKTFENFGTGVLALASGDVDMVLTDAVSAVEFVRNSSGKLKLLDEILGAEDFGIVFTQGSDLVEPFDAALEDMRGDGFMEQLAAKWLIQK